LILDGGEGAEEQAGDVGESSGAAGGDVAAGEETKEIGEGMVDALGSLEVFGVLGKQVGEVVGVGGRFECKFLCALSVHKVRLQKNRRSVRYKSEKSKTPGSKYEPGAPR
jgi:hypothetical protein